MQNENSIQMPNSTLSEKLKYIDTVAEFYDENSPFYGTKARVIFLVQHGTGTAEAMSQAARERTASVAKGVKTSKKK